MSTLSTKAEKTIKKHNLLKRGDSVLVCLSGGADSVCLLKVLCALKDKFGIKLFAAHLNHMLRDDDADADEEFAKNLCEKLNVSFYSKKADVKEYAKTFGKSTEEAGRILRYDFFEELCKKLDIDKIATAHNKNDNTETVLMRFLRGTGIFGLSGIPYKNKNIIRPLLDVSREEIEEYLAEENQDYKTDKTNLEPIYFRNKVRLNLIPEIENEYNPNFKESLSQNISNYKDAAAYLKTVTDEKLKSLVVFEKNYAYIDISDITKEHDYIKKSVIYAVLESFNVKKQTTSFAVNEICDILNAGGGRVDFSKDLYAEVIGKYLYFVKSYEKKQFCYLAEVGKSVYIKEYDKTVSIDAQDKKISKSNCIYLDFEKINGKKIEIRNRREGDSFIPSGMKNKKKIKNYFIDQKVPNFLRDEVPLIVLDGEIACIGTMRASENYKTTSNTKSFLRIEICDGGNINDTEEC